MEVGDFVLSELRAPPGRVLEVGCGNGELTRTLVAAGYSALGVDPDAPEESIFQRSTIEELEERGAYDAVVASRSLHHVADLAVALDRIAAILRPGGAVLVDEFGWERLDASSAKRLGVPLHEWREEHAHLHTAQQMLRELEQRFQRRSFSWEPYLFREAHQAVDEKRERELIEAEEIQPIGFRYVGAR